MNDMGPRRMDGFARPAAGRAQAAPRPQPRAVPAQPRPQVAVRPQRPAEPAPQRPIAYVPQPAVRPAKPEGRSARAAKPERRSGGWRVALQFFVGLVVIVGVAAAIVALYVRYYQ